jgi:Spy/CpxP family protein refolding chaperone
MMRRKIAGLVFTVVAASTVFAQGAGRPERGTPPSPEQMIERRVTMLTTLLSLDSSQQAQAKTIFTEAQSASEALRESSRAAHEALRTAVKSSASEEQIDQLAAAVGSAQAQSAAIHAKAQVKLRNILNSTQKEKLDSLGAGRGPRGPGGMMGPGHHGFRGPAF